MTDLRDSTEVFSNEETLILRELKDGEIEGGHGMDALHILSLSLDLPDQVVRRHLRHLQARGFVTTRSDGQVVFARIALTSKHQKTTSKQTRIIDQDTNLPESTEVLPGSQIHLSEASIARRVLLSLADMADGRLYIHGVRKNWLPLMDGWSQSKYTSLMNEIRRLAKLGLVLVIKKNPRHTLCIEITNKGRELIRELHKTG